MTATSPYLNHPVRTEREAVLERQVAELRKALNTSTTAIDDWLHVYAPEHCHRKRAEEARRRIDSHGGTLGYITDVQERAYATLAALSPTSNGGDTDGR